MRQLCGIVVTFFSNHTHSFSGASHAADVVFLCVLTADSEGMKALALSNAEAAFKSHQLRVSYFVTIFAINNQEFNYVSLLLFVVVLLFSVIVLLFFNS